MDDRRDDNTSHDPLGQVRLNNNYQDFKTANKIFYMKGYVYFFIFISFSF